jgi:hypothetical protein
MERHKKSTKHKNNVELYGGEFVDNNIQTCMEVTNFSDNKSFLCECGKAFSYKQGLSLHKKNTCKLIKISNNKFQEDIENNKVLFLIDALTNIIKGNNVLPNITSHGGNINSNNINNFNSNNTLTNNQNKTYNVSVMSYVTNNFTNTEPLEEIKTTDVHKFLDHGKIEGYSIEEAIIFYYQKKMFSQFIGEAIKKEYKKDNQEEQKFWASDVARLTFIVRRVLTKTKKKKENVWIKDSNGTSLLNLLIIPSLNEIKRVLAIYADECHEKIKHLDNYMVEKIGNNIFEANKIINDINLSEFEKPILRYIAPHFQLKLADNES